MSVYRPSPGNEIISAVRGSFGYFVYQNDPLGGIVPGTQAGDLEAVRIFGVELRDIAESNLRRNQTGWRFMAVSPAGNGIIVNVTAPGIVHPQPRVSGVLRGRHIGRIISQLRAIEPPRNAAEHLELALLNVPGLVETFWVKPRNKTHDKVEGWVVPFHTLITELEQEKTYRVEDLLANIKPIAERRLRSNDRARASGAS